jgi:hypothetical protein
MLSIKSIVFVSWALLAPTAATADGVRHVPPADVDAGTAIELVANVSDAGARTIVLHYRAIGATPWRDATFTQAVAGRWVATITSDQVVAPGIEYYLSSVDSAAAIDGTPIAAVDEFASALAPHPVSVRASEGDARRARDLARVYGRRSRAHAGFEWVDFGRRSSAAGAHVPDRYYRIDLDFSYRLLAYPLEEIRFGYTRLEGVVPNSIRAVPSECTSATESSAACRVDAGFKVGGWFELGVALAEGVRFDGRGMFTANQASFALGARGELRAGIADGNHLAIAVEYMADVGTIGSFRLGWASVPKVPMAMSVEVTDLPSSQRATGVRLLYDVFYPMPNGLRLGARIGYAARDQIIGGPSAGLSATYDF